MASTSSDQPTIFPDPVPGLLQALANNLEEGVIVSDAHANIIFSNNATREIYDDPKFPKTIRAHRRRYRMKLGQSEIPVEADDLPLIKILREGSVKSHQLILLTSRGKKKEIICDGRVLFDANGNKVGAILVLNDKTNQLERERHELELIKEREDLLRVNAELERFASIAAHDLKSPLLSIGMSAEILKSEFSNAIGEEGQRYLNIMVRAVTNLRELIDDLLTYARSGKGLGEINDIDLNCTLDKVLRSLQTEIESSRAEINYGHMPKLHINETGMQRVFQNLIANAIKYRSDQRPTIKIRSNENEKFILFEVEDNGIGISETETQTVFELFKRASGSNHRDGTGLGLPICKRIIELHGGSIWIKSKRGQGTTISFTIPKRNG